MEPPNVLAVRFEFGDIQPGPSLNFGVTPPPAGGAEHCRAGAGQPILPGICFSVSWNIPVNPVGFPPNSNFGTGEVGFLQTVRALRRNTDDSGNVAEINSGSLYWLDHDATQSSVLYSDISIPVNSGDQTVPQEMVNDFPNAVVRPEDHSVRVDESYRMYLMYRPAGADSIWVTLRVVPWSWSGLLTKAGAAWASEAPTAVPGVQPWYSVSPTSIDPITSPFTPSEPDGLPRWSGSTP